MRTSVQALKFKFHMPGQGLTLIEVYKITADVFAAEVLNCCSTWNGPWSAVWEGPGQQTGDNTGYTGLHITCSQTVHATVWQKGSFQEVRSM
ncbi:hypothetical protein Cfor_09653 [Coptotermes formosanus]|uniref:Uncharacterized protein n=1 Tax=Coptotermes formosanus TaxID=36987 RepID=A0A6L2Q2U4_COPFO|nr:hypothetical protein Cfor_09653 [Coptotermes formosanus]